MSPASPRAAFLKHLQAALRADLEAKGFAFVDRWNLTRRRGHYIDCIGIQESKYRDSVCVNLGVHLDFLRPSGRSLKEGEQLTEVFCVIRERIGPDLWWRFEDGEPAVADLRGTLEERGSAFFEKFAAFPGPFAATLDDVRSGAAGRFFVGETADRVCLLLANVQDFLGNPARACEFALEGLPLTPRIASALRGELKRILKKHGHP